MSPSYVPTTWKDPHVVFDAVSSPSTADQSHPTIGIPAHCGGNDSATPPKHITGSRSGSSNTNTSP